MLQDVESVASSFWPKMETMGLARETAVRMSAGDSGCVNIGENDGMSGRCPPLTNCGLGNRAGCDGGEVFTTFPLFTTDEAQSVTPVTLVVVRYCCIMMRSFNPFSIRHRFT